MDKGLLQAVTDGRLEWDQLAKLNALLSAQTDDRNHRRTEAIADAHVRRLYGDRYQPEGEDDVINWNSPVTHNHYHERDEKAPEKEAPEKETAPRAVPQGVLSTGAKVAIAAALMGSGGLATVGVQQAIKAMKTPAPEVREYKDTDTRLEIGLGRPVEE